MVVSIEVKGTEAIKKLGKISTDIKNKGIPAGELEAAKYVQSEVKASIAGRRSEKTSVDTGRFLNSVMTGYSSKEGAIVFTNIPYALFLEYGTSKVGARSHFHNSAARSEKRIREVIAIEVSKNTK